MRPQPICPMRNRLLGEFAPSTRDGMIVGNENAAAATPSVLMKSRRIERTSGVAVSFFHRESVSRDDRHSAGRVILHRFDQSIRVLLTKATRVLSGDHEGTLIVPCPPYKYAITRGGPPLAGIIRR